MSSFITRPCEQLSLVSHHPVYEAPDRSRPSRASHALWAVVGIFPAVLLLSHIWQTSSDYSSQSLLLRPIQFARSSTGLPVRHRFQSQLHAAVVTQIWPPPAPDAPSLSFGEFVTEQPKEDSAVQQEAAPAPVPATVQTSEAGVQSAVVQYDFGNAATMKDQNFDKATLASLFGGALLVAFVLAGVAFLFLSKNATKLGVELNPNQKNQNTDDFTNKYRPKPVRPVTAEDLKVENQLMAEIRRRGLDDEPSQTTPEEK